MNPSPDPYPQTHILTPSDEAELNIYSLILSSAEIPYTIIRAANTAYEIHINEQLKEKALFEIYLYLEENRNWPHPAPSPSTFSPSFKAMSFLVVGFLVIIFSISGDWHPTAIWFVNGAGDSTAILSKGEYYRLVTALMLHADVVHLMGNIFLGGVLLHFYFSMIGNGLGLFVMVTTATIANYLNVIAHGYGHNFVGFSTAVFSVIGILCTLGYSRASTPFKYQIFMPIMAGISFLALLGAGGERTDLGAHFFGLIIGLIAGVLLRSRRIKAVRNSASAQTLLTITTCLIVFFSWYKAFALR